MPPQGETWCRKHFSSQSWHPNLMSNVANNASLVENSMDFGLSFLAELAKLHQLLCVVPPRLDRIGSCGQAGAISQLKVIGNPPVATAVPTNHSCPGRLANCLSSKCGSADWHSAPQTLGVGCKPQNLQQLSLHMQP